MSQFRLKDLSYMDRFPITIQLDHGECVTLSGPSGSGKTLFLRALADLDQHQGHIFLDDKECHEYTGPQWRQLVGMLPAESRWWFDTVGPHMADSPQSQALLNKLGFEPDVMNWQVNRLSTGEKQRLAIFRLLVNRPKVLLLDEPTASLDQTNIGKVEKIFNEYSNETQAPMIWVSHDPDQAKRLSDRHLQIEKNRILEKNTPNERHHDPANRI